MLNGSSCFDLGASSAYATSGSIGGIVIGNCAAAHENNPTVSGEHEVGLLDPVSRYEDVFLFLLRLVFFETALLEVIASLLKDFGEFWPFVMCANFCVG